MNINELPLEMLEKVLLYLDGWTFDQTQFVCKRWKETYELQSVNIWKKICKREVSENVLCQIIHNQNIETATCDWKQVYFNWWNLKHFDAQVKYKTTDSYSLKFTVYFTKVFENYMISGGADNCIYLFDLKSGLLLDFIISQGCSAFLEAIIFRPYSAESTFKPPPYVIAITFHNYFKIFKIANDKLEVEHTITTNAAFLISIQHFDNKFALSSLEKHIYLWHLEARRNEVIKVINLGQIEANVPYLDVGLWKNFLIYVSKENSITQYSIDDEMFEFVNCVDYDSINDYNSEFFIQFDDGVFINRFENKCTVKEDAQRTNLINPIPYLKGDTKICLWGHILAVGCESGKIELFYVEDLKDIQNVDTANPIWTRRIGPNMIVYLDICVHENTLWLVALTKGFGPDEIYTIQFTLKHHSLEDV